MRWLNSGFVLASTLACLVGLWAGPAAAGAAPRVSGTGDLTSPLVIEPTDSPVGIDVPASVGLTVAYIGRMPVTKTVSQVTIGDLGMPSGCMMATTRQLGIVEFDDPGATMPSRNPNRSVGGSTVAASIPAVAGRVTWTIPPTTFKAGRAYQFTLGFGSGCSMVRQVTYQPGPGEKIGGTAQCSAGPWDTSRSGSDAGRRMWHQNGVADGTCVSGPNNFFDPSMPTGWLVTSSWQNGERVLPAYNQLTPPASNSCGVFEWRAGARMVFWRNSPGQPGRTDWVCMWPQYAPLGDVPSLGWFYGAPWRDGAPRDAYLRLDTPASGPVGSELNGLGNAAAPNLPRCYAGDPVNCATGNFTEAFQDIAVGGRGVGLDLTRTYNSQAAAVSGPFRYGWAFSFGDRLVSGAAGAVTVHHGDGSTAAFSPSVDGGYAAAGWVQSKLVERPDGSFAYTYPDRRKLSFTSAGRLEWVDDRNGNRTTLDYSDGDLVEITDPAGRSIELEHNPDGTIAKATDPAGGEVLYAYGAGELVSVTDVGGGETTFDYDASHRMISVIDARGKTVTNVYDGQGRVIEQTDPLLHDTIWNWSTPGETRITDSSGRVTVQRFAHNLRVSVTRGAGTAAEATWEYERDAAGNTVLVTDPNGKEWASSYDEAGNRTSVTDPLNRTTEREYDADRNVTAVVSPSGRRAEMTYDPDGNLASIAREHTETNQDQVTAFDYDPHGLLTAVTDPLDRTTAFEYNVQGDRIETITPEGHTATATYDVASRQATITTARGHAPGADPADFTTTFTRDAFGNPTDIEDPLGQHALLDYDANQNLVSITDRDGRETITRYDDADRPIEIERADGTIVETEYDPTGRVSTQIDGLDNETMFAYDGQGRLESQTDSLNRTTTYGYDNAGNLTAVVDAANRTTTNSYDDAGQLTGISYSSADPGNVSITYTLDGNRDTVTDDTGTTDYAYDSLDRLTSNTSGAGQQTGYGYDLADQLVAIDYPDALTPFDSATGTPQQPVTTGTVAREYDDDGNLVSVTDWLSNETTFTYDPDGLLSGITRPNGTSASYQHDRNGALTALTDLGDITGLGRTHEALLSSSTPPVGAPTNYGYDDAEQLTAAGTATFDYDDADNLTALAIAGQTVTQAFDDANQLTGTTAGGNPVATFDYDALGQRSAQTSAANVVTDYDYDQAGRLIGYDGPDHAGSGSVTEGYAHDADGLRQTKITGTILRNHAYDLVGSGLPSVITDGPNAYITGPDGLPIEQVLENGTVRYFHRDQLGSTTKLTNQAGNVVASYDYDAYGNPVGTLPAVENPFGYAGQYTDANTGLQYLRARYYDPGTGQFLTRDPLESTTGQPYAYANNSPTNYTDPSGLFGFSDARSFASNAAAGFLDEATFGYSTKLAGALLGFDAECAEWGTGGGTGAALGMVFGAGKIRAAARGAASLAARGAETALSQNAKRRLAKQLGGVPRSSSPLAQGGSASTGRWWEYLDSNGRKRIVVEHPDGTVHVGVPKPQSAHRAGGPPKYYDYGSFGHVGE